MCPVPERADLTSVRSAQLPARYAISVFVSIGLAVLLASCGRDAQVVSSSESISPTEFFDLFESADSWIATYDEPDDPTASVITEFIAPDRRRTIDASTGDVWLVSVGDTSRIDSDLDGQLDTTTEVTPSDPAPEDSFVWAVTNGEYIETRDGWLVYRVSDDSGYSEYYETLRFFADQSGAKIEFLSDEEELGMRVTVQLNVPVGPIEIA